MSQTGQRHKRSPAEWVTFSIALSILVSIVGLVLYSWLKVEKRPPVLVVEHSENIRQVEENFYIPFTLTNKGGETADAVQVTAELRINGKVEETGEQQIDFLAGGESEEGVFLFSHNPKNGELVLRVASYKKP
jgi:uncharacterized protein (TIGR02588 family)